MARCGLHPEEPAVATCARCGTFLCAECVELVPEGSVCEPCRARLRMDGPASRVAWGALGLGVAGLLLLPCSLGIPLPPLVAGAGALVLGLRETGRIRRAESPVRGKWPARVGWVLGGLTLLLVLVWVAMFLFLAIDR
ncbi:B-box zinc finger protein [Myxococcus faecalis]|uniref:B-box zinc finger protein n=1 Tax=Myxococcus faecalis TaxID=3115646 RepID=UPI003CEFF4F0